MLKLPDYDAQTRTEGAFPCIYWIEYSTTLDPMTQPYVSRTQATRFRFARRRSGPRSFAAPTASFFGGIIVTRFGAAMAMTQPSLMHAVIYHPIPSRGSACSRPRLSGDAEPAGVSAATSSSPGCFTFADGGNRLRLYLALSSQDHPGIVGEAGGTSRWRSFGALSTVRGVQPARLQRLGPSSSSSASSSCSITIANQHVRASASARPSGSPPRALLVLVFSGLLVFDTWRIVRGQARTARMIYVSAAVMIYSRSASTCSWPSSRFLAADGNAKSGAMKQAR